MIERHMVERGMLGREAPIEKLVFGSDCPADEIQEHIDRFERIFEEAGLTEAQVERLWWGMRPRSTARQQQAWPRSKQWRNM